VTVAVEQLGEPIDARPLMRTVRARLHALVADLDDADWRRATVCPGWDVADLVAHLVGDDLGRLSRTHDGAAGPPRRPGEDLPAYLDRINEEWVVAFRRLSPRAGHDRVLDPRAAPPGGGGPAPPGGRRGGRRGRHPARGLPHALEAVAAPEAAHSAAGDAAAAAAVVDHVAIIRGPD
jgi:hypothetical protein